MLAVVSYTPIVLYEWLPISRVIGNEGLVNGKNYMEILVACRYAMCLHNDCCLCGCAVTRCMDGVLFVGLDGLMFGSRGING